MLEMNPVEKFLPLLVYAVNYCPRNELEWQNASRKLNCTDDPTTLLHRYHCAPDHKRNNLLEFCYDALRILVPKGRCLELADSRTIDTFDCTNILPNKCPTGVYFSDQLYKYQACTEINTHDNCFRGDPKCPEENRSTTHKLESTTPDVEETISPNNQVTETKAADSNVSEIIAWTLAGVCVLVLFTVALIAWTFWKRIRNLQTDQEGNNDIEMDTTEKTPFVARTTDQEQDESDEKIKSETPARPDYKTADNYEVKKHPMDSPKRAATHEADKADDENDEMDTREKIELDNGTDEVDNVNDLPKIRGRGEVSIYGRCPQTTPYKTPKPMVDSQISKSINREKVANSGCWSSQTRPNKREDEIAYLARMELDNGTGKKIISMDDSLIQISSPKATTGNVSCLRIVRSSSQGDELFEILSPVKVNGFTAEEICIINKLRSSDPGLSKSRPMIDSPGKKRIIAAIDIGSAYSGYSFASCEELEKVPPVIHGHRWKSSMEELISPKTPTTVLLNEKKELISFGYTAEQDYANAAEEYKHGKYFYFRRFKMELKNYKTRLSYETAMRDITGKKLQALTVFKLAIEFLKKEVIAAIRTRMKFIEIEDIYWVLTVPAIWTVAEKEFMRDAAILAKIEDNLLITEEAKAVSVFCKYLPMQIKGERKTFKEGTRYIVLDAGGGTVHVTALEVQLDSDVKELDKRDGAFGGNTVDDIFKRFLEDIVGESILIKYSKTHTADYIQLFNAFELLKRNYHETYNSQQSEKQKEQDYLRHRTLYIPRTFLDEFVKNTGQGLEEKLKTSKYKTSVKLSRERLRIDKEVFNSFFMYARNGIVDLVEQTLNSETVQGTDIIIMVGGFSGSKLLQKEIKNHFAACRVVVPDDPGLAVLKGGVLFGHTNPHSFKIGKLLRSNSFG